MASIVVRKDGRAEIRESIATDRGPRSRTLAVFRELTDRDLDKAESRATRPFDRGRILARARTLGVPRYGESASRAAVGLLAELHRGHPLDGALAGALRDALGALPRVRPPDSIAVLLPHLGLDDGERGELLREKLRGLPGGRGVASTNDLYGRPTGDPRGAGPSKLPALDDRIASLAAALRGAGLDHAFGGDLALAYYTPGQPVNVLELYVFAEGEDAKKTERALRAAVSVGDDFALQLGRGSATAPLGGAARLRVVLDPRRPSAPSPRRARDVPFGEDRIAVLAPEDWLLARILDAARDDPEAPDPDVERLLFACAGRLDTDSVRESLREQPDGEPGRAWLARQVEKIAGPLAAAP